MSDAQTAQSADRGLVTETIAVLGAGGTMGFPMARNITRAGLPIGLQIMGPPLGEEACFRVGGAYEARTEWHLRRPADVGGAS